VARFTVTFFIPYQETLGLVGGYIALVGGSDGGDDELLVYVDATANRVDDLEHEIPPNTVVGVRRH